MYLLPKYILNVILTGILKFKILIRIQKFKYPESLDPDHYINVIHAHLLLEFIPTSPVVSYEQSHGQCGF